MNLISNSQYTKDMDLSYFENTSFFPKEVQYNFLNHLSPQELSRVFTVCKLWEAFSTNKFFYYDDFCMYHNNQLEKGFVRIRMQERARANQEYIEANRPHPAKYIIPVAGMIVGGAGIVVTTPTIVFGAIIGWGIGYTGRVCFNIGGDFEIKSFLKGARVGTMGSFDIFIVSDKAYKKLKRRDP